MTLQTRPGAWQRANRSKVAHRCSQAEVVVAAAADSGRIAGRVALEVTCLHRPGPKKMRIGSRGENGSNPGRRSPDISIGTSRPSGDGKNTKGCPFIAIGMPNSARSTPIPENWIRGSRAGAKRSTSRRWRRQAFRNRLTDSRLFRYRSPAPPNRSTWSGARTKSTVFARAGSGLPVDNSRSLS